MNKNTMKSIPIDETTAIKLKIAQDTNQSSLKTFTASKSSAKSWVSSALRVARYVAASALLLGSLSTVSYAQESGSLALSNGFDNSLVVLISSTEEKQAHRPYKNTTLNHGLVASLYEGRKRKLKQNFHSGKISIQQHLRELEELEIHIAGLYDELDMRNHGKVTRDNRPKAREKRRIELENNQKKSSGASVIEGLFNSISNSVRSFLSSNDQANLKSAAHLIHLAATDSLSKASISEAASIANNISEASGLLLDQSAQHQVALHGDSGSMIKRLLTQPPALKQASVHDKEALINTIKRRIEFNEKVEVDLSKSKDTFEQALMALKDSALKNSEANSADDLLGQPLLSAASMKSALLDLTTSFVNNSKTNIDKSVALNVLLKDVTIAIEADDVTAIDEISMDLAEFLNESDLKAVQHYADGLAFQEDKALYPIHSSFSMN